MGARLFGARVRRREDARLVTGRGRYVADVALPGLLHIAVHRSPHAHARIVRVDPDEARRRPGVVHVLVPADVVARGRLPLLVPHASLVAPACPEILPQEIVSHAGQAVALVVAEEAAQAEDALDALRVEYEPLPAAASLDDALRPDGPRVHPGGNVAARFTQRVGDPAGALARAPVVLRERFHVHRGGGMAMETRGISARWDGDLGQITVWSTTQSPQILRRLLARYLGLPEHAVRVVTQDIGGGFGPKGIVYAEDILVPYLGRALGRPVQFLETRREHLLAVTQEGDQWHDVELGLTREGQIVAIRDAFVHDCGAFVSWGVIVPILTSVSVPGPYRVPNYEVTLTALYTNRVPVTPVRGAGRRGGSRDRPGPGAFRRGHGARPIRGHQGSRRSDRTRVRVLRHVEPGASSRDHAGPDRRRRALGAARADHRDPRRHSGHRVRGRHVREPGRRARRHLGGPRRRRGAKEGARGRRGPLRGSPGRSQARRRPHHRARNAGARARPRRGGGDCECAPARLRAARRDGPRARGHGLRPRPPVDVLERRPRRGGRGRRRDRDRAALALRRRGRLRHDDQPTGGRGPDSRRHRPRHRQRPARGDRLRRNRAARDRHADGLCAAARDRRAASRGAPRRDAFAAQPARRQGRGRGRDLTGARRDRERGGRRPSAPGRRGDRDAAPPRAPPPPGACGAVACFTVVPRV